MKEQTLEKQDNIVNNLSELHRQAFSINAKLLEILEGTVKGKVDKNVGSPVQITFMLERDLGDILNEINALVDRLLKVFGVE